MLRIYRPDDDHDESVGLVFDEGDGGIFILHDGYVDLVEVSELPDGWVELRR